MRRLKRLTGDLLGTGELYRELCLHPHAEDLKVPIDSDCADDQETRQSCSAREVHQMFGSTMFARVAVQSRAVSANRHTERTCGVQAKRSWSNETHRVDDAHSAQMHENGTTSYPQSIGSRQSGRPHDQGHDQRATAQVRTCSELARINLHRLGPTCTLTRGRPIRNVSLKNTVKSFQDHRHTANLRTTIETGSTMRKKNSSQLSAENSNESAECQLEQDGRGQHDGWYGRQLRDLTSKGDSAQHRHQLEVTT